jgi:1-deoxy-D-xylulose-5-phosphate reductoisomerase
MTSHFPVRVAVAGSSGSIGTQTLEVIRAQHGSYQVVGLAVGSSVDLVVAQAREFLPQVVVVTDESARIQVAHALRSEGLRSIEVSGRLVDLVPRPMSSSMAWWALRDST